MGADKTVVVCSQCGARRWTMKQMLRHVKKKHPKGSR